MNIRIIPKCKRARERVKQHGEVMKLTQEGNFHGQPAILVCSLEKTWGGEHFWRGWFTDKEADWREEPSR